MLIKGMTASEIRVLQEYRRMQTESMPVAKRQRSVSSSSLWRNSAQHEKGTRLLSFDEISAMVSATPRLVPIAWAISYSA